MTNQSPLPPDQVPQLLRAHQVRLTPGRRQVLGILLQASCALSGREIAAQLSRAVDRATLFRSLRLLEPKGLIHRVVDYTEILRFAPNPALLIPPSPALLPAEHVHFKCTACQRIYCLPQLPVPGGEAVPGSHLVTRRDFLVSGVCVRCLPPPPA